MAKAQTKTEEHPEDASLPMTAEDQSQFANAPRQVSAEMLERIKGRQKHVQKFDSSQLTIPRIALLQDMSPQVKTGPDQVEGALPGMFWHPVYKVLSPRIKWIPIYHVVRWIAWRPRNDGGGMVNPNLTLRECEENFQQTGPGQWIGHLKPSPQEDAVRVEVNETLEWVCMTRGTTWNWDVSSVSFGGTKAREQRDINSEIQSRTVVDPGTGEVFGVPAYHNWYEFGAKMESKGSDSWFNFNVVAKGDVEVDALIEKCAEVCESYESGKMVLDDENIER